MPDAGTKPSKVGMILIGIFEILLGTLAGLMALFLVAARTLVNNAAMPANQPGMVFIMFFYLGIAAAFITFAVGTIQGRRWARKLMMVLSGFGLMVGVLALGMMVWMMPIFDKALQAGGAATPGVATFAKILMLVMITIMYIIIPGILFLFYRHPKVVAAFETLDPEPSWTDKCPAPVLGMSMILAMGATWLPIMMPSYNFAFPVFGTFVTGWVGALFCVPVWLGMAYSAWGSYHLKREAWWVTLGLLAFGTVSGIWTLSKVGLVEMYQAMNFPAVTIETLKQSGMLDLLGSSMPVMVGVSCLFYFGFLIYVRKFFFK